MAKKKDKKEVEKKLEEEIKTKTEEELRQKCKDLASIIEEMSGGVEGLNQSQMESIIEPKIKEVDQKLETHVQELKGAIEDLSKKVEKPVKMKGDAISAINEISGKLEPRLTNLEEQIKSLDKIRDLEEQIKSITGDSKKSSETTPKKLSLLEEKVIQTMQEEIILVKESLQNLSNEIDIFRDKTDKKMQKFFEHLSPETVKKLEELIAYLDKAVPSKVREEVGEKLNSLFDQLKILRDFSNDLEKRLNETSNEVKDDRDKIKSILEFKHELKGSIIDLEINKEKISKQIEEIDKKAEKRNLDLEFKFKNHVDALNKRFEDFEEVLNNYTKITQDRVNKILSDFSENNLSKTEKKYYNALSSTQQNIKNLESQVKKFVDFVNLNLGSVKENAENLNLNLEEFKELEKQENLRLDKKIDLQKSDIQNLLNEHTEFIKNEVNRLFSTLTEQKLSELEKRYHDYLSKINGDAKIIQSKLSKFEKTFNSTLNLFDGRIKNINSDIGKFKENYKEVHSRLNKKIDFDIINLENLVKEKSENIENNVSELFSNLAKSKISEIDKRFNEINNEINEKSKILDSKSLEFKDIMDSNLTSFDNRIKKINSDIEKLNETYSNLNKKITSEMTKLNDILKQHSENIENNVNDLFSNLSKSKTSEIDNRFGGIVKEINEKNNILNSQLSEFKNTINSNLTSFTEEMGKINFQLNKINEKQTEFAFKNDIDNINEKFKDVIQEAVNIRSIKEQIEKNVKRGMSSELDHKLTSLNSRISGLKEQMDSIKNMVKKELDKKITADKIKFEETLEKIMNEKRTLEKILNEQNEKINSILGELNTE